MKYFQLLECDGCGECYETGPPQQRSLAAMRRQMTPEWHHENMWEYCGRCGEAYPLRVQWYEAADGDAADIGRAARFGLDVRPMLAPVT